MLIPLLSSHSFLKGIYSVYCRQLYETELTIGVCQIHQAKSYTKEYQTDDRKYEIMINKEDGKHRFAQENHTIYEWNTTQEWILSVAGIIHAAEGLELSVVVHILRLLIWYLGFEWHQPITKSPKVHNKFMKAFTIAAGGV